MFAIFKIIFSWYCWIIIDKNRVFFVIYFLFFDFKLFSFITIISYKFVLIRVNKFNVFINRCNIKFVVALLSIIVVIRRLSSLIVILNVHVLLIFLIFLWVIMLRSFNTLFGDMFVLTVVFCDVEFNIGGG